MGFIIHVSDDTEKEVRELKGLVQKLIAGQNTMIDAIGVLRVEIQTLRKELKHMEDVLLPIITSTKEIVKASARVLTDTARAVNDLKGAQVPNAANVANLAKTIQDQADAMNTAADNLEQAEDLFENPPATDPAPVPTPDPTPVPPTDSNDAPPPDLPPPSTTP